MHWKTPDFQEISLSGEVTAYVNTDDDVYSPEPRLAQTEPAAAPRENSPVAAA